jgi:cytoskeletal protein CcmA (bactofilin family)
MSNIFHRVIGQDPNDPNRKGQGTAPGIRAPEPLAPPAGVLPPPGQGQGQAQAPVSRPQAVAARNILSTDVEIKGTVKFTNDLLVDGKIEGEITSDGNLTIGENARIKAEVRTATITVYGKVQGNITATERIDLKASAEIIGDIKAKVLTIEAGAVFVGKSTVGAQVQTAAPAQAAQGQKPAGAPQQQQPQQGKPGNPPQQQQPQQQGKPGNVPAKQPTLPGAV